MAKPLSEQAPTLAALAALIPGAQAEGATSRSLHRAQHDSREVEEGDLYVALPGRSRHGLDFLDEALQRGACAVALRPEDRARLSTALAGRATPPLLLLDAPRRALPLLAARCWGEPAKQLKLYGVTGTNGKSSTTSILHRAFAEAEGGAGLLGTIETCDGGPPRPALFTTPEAPVLHSAFAKMVTRGLTRCVMEVSSIGLEEARLDGLRFTGAAFLNLSQDHLDYHGTMSAYLQAKAHLFHALLEPSATLFINDGDPAAQVIRAQLPDTHHGPRWSFGIPGAEIRWEGLRADATGLRGRLCTPAGALALSSPLLGSFNQENIAAAASLALAEGISPEAISEAVAVTRPRGRMERVPGPPERPTVVIDYAHTPAALAAALRALRALLPAGGRLWCLFGCGGERDQGKRAAMGAAAAEADGVILSNDNPRREAPEEIAEATLKGLLALGWREHDALALGAVWRCLDRRHAIEVACRSLPAGALLLIAGKGHERYQEVAGTRHPFDDREIAYAALSGERGEEL